MSPMSVTSGLSIMSGLLMSVNERDTDTNALSRTIPFPLTRRRGTDIWDDVSRPTEMAVVASLGSKAIAPAGMVPEPESGNWQRMVVDETVVVVTADADTKTKTPSLEPAFHTNDNAPELLIVRFGSEKSGEVTISRSGIRSEPEKAPISAPPGKLHSIV